MAALGEEVEVGDEDQRSNISEKKGQMAPGTLGCGPLWFLQACATFCQVVEASTVVEEVVDLTAEVGEEGWCRTGGGTFKKYTFVN